MITSAGVSERTRDWHVQLPRSSHNRRVFVRLGHASHSSLLMCTRAYMWCAVHTRYDCNVPTFTLKAFSHLVAVNIDSLCVCTVSPFLTHILSLTHLIRPRVCNSSYMSLVHPQQLAAVNAVSLPNHRGFHTHASRPSYQHPSPSNVSRHSVASSCRQKRTFFGIGEILQVVANVRTSFRLPSIARLRLG